MSASLLPSAPSIAQFFLRRSRGRAAARSFASAIFGLAVWVEASNGAAEGLSYTAYYNGETLYRECTGEPHAQSRCLGYVAGVADMLAAALARGDVTIACVPAEVTADEARDVVVRFLRDSPQSRHRAAASLIELALGDAYPCRW
jgi:hypothetical protein